MWRTFPAETSSASGSRISSCGHVGLGVVDLIEVDVIGPQPAERGVDAGQDPLAHGLARTVIALGVIAELELRRDDGLAPPAGERVSRDAPLTRRGRMRSRCRRS